MPRSLLSTSLMLAAALACGCSYDPITKPVTVGTLEQAVRQMTEGLGAH